MSSDQCRFPAPLKSKSDYNRWSKDLKTYVDCERKATLSAVRKEVSLAQEACRSARSHAEASARDVFTNSSLFATTVAEAASRVVLPQDVANAAAQRVTADQLAEAMTSKGLACTCPSRAADDAQLRR